MIKTESGNVSGLQTQDGAVSIFKGIPYARPPLGSLRWKAPEKFPSWPGTRECLNYSPNPIQPPQQPFFMWSEEFIIDTSKGYSEDCLTLNIFCPSNVNVKGKPVIVYFHGGSFTSGASSCEIYNGEQLARHGVIFVTMNFREGILGLLASSELSRENALQISGNYQLLDQIAALKWVRNNIEEFGGNPENVTIMGQSSGGATVNNLSISPLAKGLFKRVFSMSHETLNFPVSASTNEHGELVNKDIYKRLSDCEHEGDLVFSEELRTKTPDELLKLPNFFPFAIDGHVLTCTFKDGVRAGLTDEYDFIVTYTANDPLLFDVMRDLAVKPYDEVMHDFFGEYADRAMRLYPLTDNPQQFTFNLSRDRYIASVMMLSEMRKGNTWMGEFDHVMPGPEASMWGAFHTSDVPYWLDYFSDKRKDYWRDEDYALGAELVARLTAYAQNGTPNADGLSDWRPNSFYRIEAGNIHEAKLLDDVKYEIWRDFYCVK